MGAQNPRPESTISALELHQMNKKGKRESTRDRVDKREQEIREAEQQLCNLQIEIE